MNRASYTPQQLHQFQQAKLQQQHLQQEQQKKQQQQQQQQQLKFRSQPTPLGLSQMANIQAQREALAARVKISQRKSLLMEDDMEFCPQPADHTTQMRPQLLKRSTGASSMVSNSQGSLHGALLGSPYSTPVKINPAHQSMGQRLPQQGYMSHPQHMHSPQHVYSSPQGIMRRMDNMSYSTQSPGHHW